MFDILASKNETMNKQTNRNNLSVIKIIGNVLANI